VSSKLDPFRDYLLPRMLGKLRARRRIQLKSSTAVVGFVDAEPDCQMPHPMAAAILDVLMPNRLPLGRYAEIWPSGATSRRSLAHDAPPKPETRNRRCLQRRDVFNNLCRSVGWRDAIAIAGGQGVSDIPPQRSQTLRAGPRSRSPGSERGSKLP